MGYDLCLDLDLVRHRYTLSINEEIALSDGHCAGPAMSVGQLVFRTGPRRREPILETEVSVGDDLPGADDPVAQAVYFVNHVRIHGAR